MSVLVDMTFPTQRSLWLEFLIRDRRYRRQWLIWWSDSIDWPQDCVNFRQEKSNLHRKQDENDTVLTNQILKGTVVEISSHLSPSVSDTSSETELSSRYRLWAVEHDVDHGYNAMYKGLFAFLSAPADKKSFCSDLKSSHYLSGQLFRCKGLTQEERGESVINKACRLMITLIAGPSGTGKTSIFARQLIERLHAKEDSNILVMAYTNRAVDERCAAICQAFWKMNPCVTDIFVSVRNYHAESHIDTGRCRISHINLQTAKTSCRQSPQLGYL